MFSQAGLFQNTNIKANVSLRRLFFSEGNILRTNKHSSASEVYGACRVVSRLCFL